MFNKPLLKNNWNVYLVMVYYMRVLCTVHADHGSDDDLFFASVMCVSHGNNSIFSLSRSKRVDQCISLFLSRDLFHLILSAVARICKSQISCSVCQWVFQLWHTAVDKWRIQKTDKMLCYVFFLGIGMIPMEFWVHVYIHT